MPCSRCLFLRLSSRSFTKLHNTETSLFFPWLRELVPREDLPPLSEFDREREGVVRIGKKIGQVLHCTVKIRLRTPRGVSWLGSS